MELPKKCGSVYIKFDKEKNPEYGFIVDEEYGTKRIRKFLIMTNKNINTIILPNLVHESIVSAKEIKSCTDELTSKHNNRFDKFERYVFGEVEICENCFKGIKKAKIVIPFNGSIMIDYGSFDNNAQIEFVTDQNLSLKHVYRIIDTIVGYEHENWTLVADKSLKFDGFLNGDECSIQDYNNVSINHQTTFYTLTNSARENEQGSPVL